jgi:hypothetical protein
MQSDAVQLQLVTSFGKVSISSNAKQPTWIVSGPLEEAYLESVS